MLKIEIFDADMQQLHYERFHQLHPRVMLKMEVVYLKGLGLQNALVSRITGVCDNTIRGYLKEYAAGGIEQLKRVKWVYDKFPFFLSRAFNFLNDFIFAIA
jgi:hypothetical protein